MRKLWWNNIWERKLIEYLADVMDIYPTQEQWDKEILPDWNRYCMLILNKIPGKINEEDIQAFIRHRPEIFSKARTIQDIDEDYY